MSYKLETSRIKGPVMEYSLSIDEGCPFVKNVEFVDIFNKMHCMLHTDSKMYGQLLDMTSVNLGIHRSIEIIITTNYLLCIEDKTIKSINNMT